MTYGGYDETDDDPWEREYAAYLQRMLDKLYWDELEAQYQQEETEQEGDVE